MSYRRGTRKDESRYTHPVKTSTENYIPKELEVTRLQQLEFGPKYYIDLASKYIKEGRLRETIPVVAYHGFRSKKSIDDIQKSGVGYYHRSMNEAKKDIDEALDHFGKEHPDEEYGYIGGLEGSGSRWNIWVSLYEDAPDSWAKMSPEIVSVNLEFNEIPVNDIMKYNSAKYGRPVVVKTIMDVSASSIFSNPSNINTGRNTISPNQILEIREVEG